MRRLGGAAAAAAVMLMLTGCGSQATAPTTAPTVTVAPPASASASASTTPSSSASSSTAPSSPASTAADPGRPSGQCADSDIGVDIRSDPGGAGAGSVYYDVLFVNTGGETCQLRGTPGVSVVGDGDGTQLGPAAARNQQSARTISLKPGDTVSSRLQVVNISPNGGPLDGCTVVKGNGYRVYPPHSTKAFFVKDSKAVACANGPVFMTANPVQAL